MGIKQLLVPLTEKRKKKNLDINRDQKLFDYILHIFSYILFCVQQKKKLRFKIQVWINLGTSRPKWISILDEL